MTFIVYGLNIHEQMPLDKLFKQRIVEKTQKIAQTPAIDPKKAPNDSGRKSLKQKTMEQVYQTVERLQQNEPVLYSNQIMTSPVVTLTTDASIVEAQKLFESKRFRHVPIISNEDLLVGMVSDRDIMCYLGGLTTDSEHGMEQRTPPPAMNDPILQLMQKRVLTASVDTDIRYVALLFVEQRIGAMPIMNDGKLLGIITRSDILRAVMRHFELQLWV